MRGRAERYPIDPPALSDQPTPAFRSAVLTDARAQLVDGEFTLLAGSKIALKMDTALVGWAETTLVQHRTREELRRKLIAEGALRAEDDFTVATRDIVFSSPSAAAATVLGRASSNGRVEWKTEDKQTFAQWEKKTTAPAA